MTALSPRARRRLPSIRARTAAGVNYFFSNSSEASIPGSDLLLCSSRRMESITTEVRHAEHRRCAPKHGEGLGPLSAGEPGQGCRMHDRLTCPFTMNVLAIRKALLRPCSRIDPLHSTGCRSYVHVIQSIDPFAPKRLRATMGTRRKSANHRLSLFGWRTLGAPASSANVST